MSVTGDGTLIAATPLLAAALTRDPVQISLVTAAGYLPWLVVGVFSGALVDRWDRRRVMIVADLVRLVVLAVFGVGVLAGWASVWWLVVTVFAVGVGGCFFDPAAQAMMARIVGREPEALRRANSAFWSIDTFGRSLAGPAAGSTLFALARPVPFLVDAVSFAASALCVGRLPADRHDRSAADRPSLWGEVRIGAAHLWASPVLRLTTFGTGLYNLGYNIAYATFVLFALDRMHVPAAVYGVLLAVGALGGIVGGSIGPVVGRHLSPAGVYSLVLAVQGGGWLLMVIWPTVWSAAVGLVVIGIASVSASVVGGALRQQHSPDAVVARVVAFSRVVGVGAAGLGALVGGVTARAWGPTGPLLVGAVCLAVAAGAYLALALRGVGAGVELAPDEL